MPEPDPEWRPLEARDLLLVQEIADRIHPGLPESPAVFAEKVSLFPAGCLALESGGAVVGYGIAHAWRLDRVPPLDRLLVALPDDPEVLYIHDVAILPQARGGNRAAEFVRRMTGVADSLGVTKLALVSVYGTDLLWWRLGFRVVEDARLATILRSYGPSAKYMVSRI